MYIKFYTADWCPKCKALYPILEEIASMQNVHINTINVGGQNMDEYKHILTLPTLEFISDKGKTKTLVGLVSKDKILKNLEEKG
ncbi:MAG: thioredoxin family protein [Oscillospiraceae bacterium]